jgi:enamine deaminase RidA (YjgF/YER057c/UK114 family)
MSDNNAIKVWGYYKKDRECFRIQFKYINRTTFFDTLHFSISPLIMVSSKSLPEIFNPPGVAPPSKPTFSHVSTFTIGPAKIITLARQIGTAPDGTVPTKYTEQVSNAIRNVKLCLAAAGATPRNIMKVRHYVVNYDPAEKSRQELWAKFWMGRRLWDPSPS